ncbi:uncharacterized protein LOC127844945 [Dreissena polymorpha]|nr:uncharacterized protein LOC127844945 [Dreissena polymorpha]
MEDVLIHAVKPSFFLLTPHPYRQEMLDDINTNAKNLSNKRPTRAPSANAIRNIDISRPNERTSSLHATAIRSSGSLPRTPSIETPLGLVRNTSSNSMEPVRMHSGTSSENFKREISTYKLNAMPALAEDEIVLDEETGSSRRSSKTNDKSKIKRTKPKRVSQDAFAEVELESEDMAESGNLVPPAVGKKEASRRFTRVKKFFVRFFACTRANKNDEFENGQRV